MLIPLSTIIQ